MSERVFCPCPWTGMYVHLNRTLPCPFNKHGGEYSPLEYRKSNFLKELKTSFENGEFHPSCNVCEKRERDGLKSGRQEYLKTHNDKSDVIKRMEVRFSNLCNFKCRMCEPNSSSEFAREQLVNVVDFVYNIEEDYIDEIKKFIGDVEVLTLTGGEPFLIKKYYDFIDYLVDSGHSKHIKLIIYTNGSVYNPLIIERLKQFKDINLVISLDGVGKTAEYIRHGTKWSEVDYNIKDFLKLPFDITIHTILQSYVIFDLFNFCKYLNELSSLRTDLKVKSYTIINPKQLRVENIPEKHKEFAIEQINNSIGILDENRFSEFVNELYNIKNIIGGDTVDYQSFTEFTERFDKMRAEKFENVFGFSL